jgi:hypothetical protein
VSKIGRKIMQINSKFKIQNSKLFTVLSFKDHHWRVGGSAESRPANDDAPRRARVYSNKKATPKSVAQ